MCWKPLLLIAVLVIVWSVVGFALAPEKGLDFTDESLYLLSADPPTRASFWGLPFGWHTSPLFAMVGYNISLFRTVGAFLLFVAAGCVGWVAAQMALIGSESRNQSPGRLFAVIGWLFAATAGVGSLMFYAGMLRVPGYNWLNLLGILTAGAGILGIAKTCSDRSTPNLYKLLLWVIPVAFGAFLTIPAKPSSPIAILALMALSVALTAGLKQSLRATLVAATALASLVFIAIASGLWPRNFLHAFTTGIFSDAPPLLEQHSISGAVQSALTVPWTFLNQVGNLPYAWFILLFMSIALFAIRNFKQHTYKNLLSALLLLFASILCLYANGVSSSLIQGADRDRWNTPMPVTTGLLLTTVCFVLALLHTGKNNVDMMSLIKATRYTIIYTLFLTAMPFVFSFGSGHGAYNQAFLASGLFPVAAGYALLSSRLTLKMKAASVAILFAYATLLSSATILDSRRNPQRCPDLAQNTVLTEVGPRGSRLYLAPDNAQRVNTLRQAFEEHAAGGPPSLVPIVWSWSTGITYAFRSALPDCLMLTIFGYPNSVALAKYNISHRLGNVKRPKSWILIGDARTWFDLTDQELKSHPVKNEELLTVAQSFARGIGRTFPVDYESVFTVNGLQVWKPKSINLQ